MHLEFPGWTVRTIVHSVLLSAVISAATMGAVVQFLNAGDGQLADGQIAISEAPPQTQRPMEREWSFEIVAAEGRPVAGAEVTAWGVVYPNGSFGLDEALFPPLKSDAKGSVRIVFPDDTFLAAQEDTPRIRLLRKALDLGLTQVALRVEHADHPRWSKYIELAGRRRIELATAATIVVRARLGDGPRPVRRLYPMLSRGWWEGREFSEADGVLTIRRVDLSTDQASRWLRVVHIPENGQSPVLFGDLINLTDRQERPITLDIAMKPAVRFVGRLSGDVPRPVRNGRIVGAIVTGPNSWDGWYWSVTAEIGEDGKFVLESLPPDENLQLIALCDGWVSRSPTEQEVREYSAEHRFEISHFHPAMGHVHPRLFRVDARAVVRSIPMERTSTCEVTVSDQEGRPIPDAAVSFWPNEFWINGGSMVLGNGIDMLARIRTELATGRRRLLASALESSLYTIKTDPRGIAVVRNLPAGGAADATIERKYEFTVHHADYDGVTNVAEGEYPSVKLLPGQAGSIAVQLKRK